MKKFIVTAILFHFFLFVYSQEKTIRPYVNLKWAPAGLYLGNLSLQGEYNFGKNSLTAKIGIPLNHQHTFSYDGKDALFDMKATCFQTGYRHYLSKRKCREHMLNRTSNTFITLVKDMAMPYLMVKKCE